MIYLNFDKDKQRIYPVTSLQEAMYSDIKLGQCDYFEFVEFKLKEKLDIDLIKNTLYEIMKNQEVFRTVFRIAKGKKPVQVLLNEFVVPLYMKKAPKPDIDYEPWNFIYDVEERRIRLQYNHIIIDGWSVSIFFEMFFEVYACLLIGERAKSYATKTIRDYHVEIKKCHFDSLEKVFWEEQISGVPSVLSENIICKGIGKEKITIELSKEQTEYLRKYAAENKVTPAIVIYDEWARTLHKYCGNNDVKMQIVQSGRGKLSGFEKTMGMFAQVVPLKVEIGNNSKEDKNKELTSIKEYLDCEYVKSPLAGANATETMGKRNAQDICDTLVAVENYPINKSLRDKIDKFLFYERPSYKFTLLVQIGEKIECTLTSNDPSVYSSLAQILKCFVAMLCNDNIAEASLSGQTKDYDSNNTLDIIIRDACEKYSDIPAIKDEDDTITFSELLQKSTERAEFLRENCVKKGDAVGVNIKRSREQLLWVYATELVGAIYVPFVDMPSERALHMIKCAKVKLIVSDHDDEWTTGCKWVNISSVSDFSFLSDENNSEFSNCYALGTKENDPAYILFTSGSTGNPKGCEISHKSIINRLVWNVEYLELDHDTVQLYKTAISFDVSIIEIFSIFFTGGLLVVLSDGKEKYPDEMLNVIKNNQINYIHFVPSMLRNMMEYMHIFSEEEKFSTVKKLVCSGEILPWNLVHDVYSTFNNSKIQVVNLYGPTEAAVDVSYYLCERKGNYDLTPIGNPIYNTELFVVDKYGNIVPEGVKGELYISGICLGNKYVNEPELTDAVFVLFDDGKRAYKTGDVAYKIPGGGFVVTGRNDDQIKWKGVRLEKYELVNQALRSRLISNAVVLHMKGENEKLVLCYESDKKCENELRTWMDKHVQQIMQPSDYMQVEKFPITKHGKIDIKKLISQFNNNSSDISMEKNNRSMTSIELELAELWKNVLGSQQSYNQLSNFFVCGGTSLSLIQLLIEIKKKWNVKLDSGMVYDKPFLGEIAQLIDTYVGKIECKNESEDVIISNQKNIASYLVNNPDSTAYNMPILFEVQPMVNMDVLKKAFTSLMKNNLIFLHTYIYENDNFYVLALDKEVDIQEIKAESMEEFEEIKTDLVKPFTWGEALARVCFVTLDIKKYVFFDISHLICDQNIMKRLMLELKNAYMENVSESMMSFGWKDFSLDFDNNQPMSDKLFANYSMIYPDKAGKLGHLSFNLGDDLIAGIRLCANKKGVSLFEVMSTIFAQFCHLLTGKDKFVIETNTVGESENVSEMQLQLIPLIVNYKEISSFSDLSMQIHSGIMNGISGGKSSADYDVMFIREEKFLTDEYMALFSDVEFLNQESKNALSLFYSENEDGLDLCFDYDKGLFDAEMIEGFKKLFLDLSQQICECGNLDACDIDCMQSIKDDGEREYYPLIENKRNDISIQRLFVNVCLDAPDEVVIYSGDDSITRKQLFEKVTVCAKYLKSYINKGEFVGVLQEVSTDYIVSIFSVLLAGGCFVPLDITQPAERNENNLKSCGCFMCITRKGTTFDNIKCFNLEDMHGNEECNLLDLDEYSVNDRAYCIFTSGSTGKPKSCVIYQKNILNYMHWANEFYCCGKKQIFAFFTSPAVDMTITSTLLPITYGHSIAIYPQAADSIFKIVKDENVTIIKATPSHLRLLNNVKSESNIHCVIVGGEQFTSELANKTQKCFGKGTKIYNEYGPTEASVACMIYQYTESDKFSVVPVGYAIENMRVSIVDSKNNLCMPGIQGEMVLEGINVIPSYFGVEGRFEEKEDGSWRYYTGDRARVLSNGIMIYDGREDEQFKINGYRIELAEISKAAQEIEKIHMACALMNQGKLWLFCVKKAGENISEVELRKQLFTKLPNYMMPSRIRFIDEIPIAVSGKTNVKLLKEYCVEEKERIGIENAQYASSFLRECWTEVLGNSNFSNDDGFFEAGGNSISIVVLHNKIKSKYPDITVSDLFCYPSVNAMSKHLTWNENDSNYDIRNYNHKEKIAIVGIGFMLPQANDLEELDEVFSKGLPVTVPLSEQRLLDEKKRISDMGLDSIPHRFNFAPYLEHIDLFDHKYFHVTEEQVELMNPLQRLFMITTDKAFEDAGYTKESLKGKNCAVLASSPTEIVFNEYIHQCFPKMEKISPLNNVPSTMTGRVQHLYDLHGPAYLVDCACSSGLVALHNACHLLKSEQCDIALVGGVNLIETIDWEGKERSDVLSPYNHAKVFSSDADGTSRGEGSICLVLERESDAKEKGKHIYASIYGSKINNDGFSTSLTAPNGIAQQKLLEEAWKESGVTAEDISMIESHGTGTKLGDSIELEALNRAMNNTKPGQCILSATKSIYGHLDAMSGLLGVLKCVTALEYRKVYPQLSFAAPAEFEWMSSPFYRPVSAEKWIINNSDEYVCGVSSFGLSGTNVHMVLGSKIKDTPIKQSFTRLNLSRYWVKEAEVIVNNNISIQNNSVLNTEKFSRKEIRERIITKFKSMLNIEEVDTFMTLTQLGIDSITIIQIRIFLKKEFGYDNEIDSLETLESIIQKIESKKVIVVENKENLPAKNKERIKTTTVNNSWRNYVLKYHLQDFFDEYIKKTAKSRQRLLDEKLAWANGRFMTGYSQEYACLSYPILAKKAVGAKLWDVDGNEYVDFAMGFGSIFLGYNNSYIMDAVRKSTEDRIILGALMDEPFRLAERICATTGLERVSFCNSGTEAVMNLIRIARAATNREKIVVFGGSFHGTFDPVYVQKNEWQDNMTPIPRSVGTPMHYMNDIIMLPYDEVSLDEIKKYSGSIAAVLVEPVQSRHPALQPKEFLKHLRSLTEEFSILLIFDEVINGFRSGIRGAQGYFGVEADLVAYGKVIGGGFPFGVFGGKAKYLDLIDHRGGLTSVGNSGKWVSTGGTFNGHPATIAAAHAVMDVLETDGDKIYDKVNAFTEKIANELNRFFVENSIKLNVEYFCSQFSICGDDISRLRLLQYMMINSGIYVWEGGTCFVSDAHTEKSIEYFIETVKKCSIKIQNIFDSIDNKSVSIGNEVNWKDYPKLLKLIDENPDIMAIELLDEANVRVLSHNVALRSKRQDVSSITIKLKQKIGIDILKNTLNNIVNSYKTLRSGVKWRGLNQPVSLEYKKVNMDLKIHTYDSELIYEGIQSVITQRKDKGFKLEKPPLINFDFLYNDEEQYLIMSYFNSWFDGWSVDVILKRMQSLINNENTYEKMNQNEYKQYVLEKKDFAERYWLSMDIKQEIESVPNSILSGNFMDMYEKEIKISYELNKEINDLISKKENQNEGNSIVSLYLMAMSRAIEEKVIVTTISGRNFPIENIEKEVGLFSGLVVLSASNIIDIQKQLYEINRIPVCSLAKLAKYLQITDEQLTNVVMMNGIIILNQSSLEESEFGAIVSDQSYSQVPRRCYITPGKNIKIIADRNVFPEDKAIDTLERFRRIIIEIIRG